MNVGVKYETFVIGSDEDIQVLFHCRWSFSEVRIPELLAKLEDGVDSSEASTLNPQSMTMGGASTSMPVVAPSGPIPYPPRVVAGTDGVSRGVPDFEVEAGPDQVENAMWEDDSDDELIGQSFQSKEEVVLSVKDYSIRRGVEYRVMESDHLKYNRRCKKFGKWCTWMIRITLRQRKSTWKVKRYNGPHTYLATSISSDHRQLDYHVIYVTIFSLVRADASVTIKVLQEAPEATYGFRPSYKKVWMAKQKAVAQIYSDWEESYGELSRWILGVTSTMEGTIALLKTSPIRVGDQRLVSIDDTHLYGRYGGTLLLAIAQDGNSNIFPVAFALVEGKNAESWAYFLSNQRRHVTPQLSNLVISDRHIGIKAALEALDSASRGQDSRRLLVNAAYAKTVANFDYWFDIMRTENLAMCDWANRMEYDRWTQHKDGGRRYGHMTTNISECVNFVLKGTRNLPVTSLVKSTYLRLPELFVVRGNFSLGTYQVSLRDRTCDCSHFQALHYPCCYAIACCVQSRLDCAMYVDEVYSISERVFGYHMTHRLSSLTLSCDELEKGEPRSTRICNNMDEADSGRPKRCGLCRQPGHTRRSCPQRGSTIGS
ncbi:uncharacterized protein LOC107462568 [Arachis duranensis]|uniref:Uncharacterized protein LOC107462568 n=1 Tax=Arachis duranensis TaxID=130453 RepID=A0A6P4C2M2_ARADU|nr:uncharacterized protein LOC107462568 [Arachis duranensis]